jgi:hypothetical protein
MQKQHVAQRVQGIQTKLSDTDSAKDVRAEQQRQRPCKARVQCVWLSACMHCVWLSACMWCTRVAGV